MTGRMVFAAFYGINTKPHNDPYVAVAEGPQAEAARAMAGIPGLVVRLSIFVFNPCSLFSANSSVTFELLTPIQYYCCYQNVFPMIKKFPSRFPGAGWLKEVLRWKRITKDVINLPWNKGKALAVRICLRLLICTIILI
jgi:hypothetical protein